MNKRLYIFVLLMAVLGVALDSSSTYAQEVTRFSLGADASALLDAAWDVNGDWLFLATDNGVLIYDETFSVQGNIEAGKYAKSLDVTADADGHTVIAVAIDNSISLWIFEPATGKAMAAHSIDVSRRVEVVRFAQDGTAVAALHESAFIEGRQFYSFSVWTLSGVLLGGFDGYISLDQATSETQPIAAPVNKFIWGIDHNDERQIFVLGQIFELKKGIPVASTFRSILVFSGTTYQYLLEINASGASPYFDIRPNPRNNTIALAHSRGVDVFICCEIIRMNFISTRLDNYGLAWADDAKTLVSNVAIMDAETLSEMRFPRPEFGTILRWRPHSDDILIGYYSLDPIVINVDSLRE